MTNNFKKLHAEAAQRAAVPQIDLESTTPPTPVAPPPQRAQEAPRPPEPAPTDTSSGVQLTAVDTSEQPVNRGFHMYPTRHRQVVRDLAYIEDRKPWLIIEDALEEYVVRHYGREHKRRQGGASRGA